MKLNVLLGKVDHLASTYNAVLKDYIKFFKNSQGAFLGEKKTYTPREGTIDEPSKRGNILVQTTVDEKLEWLEEVSLPYVDSLFSVEATNASGNAKAELTVEGESWGEFTSLELLRLKSFLESNDLKGMLENIPVRSDAQIWEESSQEEHQDRTVFQTPLLEGIAKTTEKTSYVLEDPNIGKLKDSSSYTPQLATKTEVMELGDYTLQHFSGMWSQTKRAYALRKRATLLTAVVEALKVCNQVETVKSELNSNKIFGYILG